jgi:pyridoxine kinase
MFKNEVISLADILTPNQFELEALTGIKTENLDNTLRAIEALHAKGPGIVLVTSYRSEVSPAGSGGGVPEGGENNSISMLVSDKSGVYRISTPELPLGAGVAGTGDLTASVFLSRYLETHDVKRTLELCTASVYGILEASYQARRKTATNNVAADGASGSAANNDEPLELLIIQAQQELVSPSRLFEAVKL